MSHTIRLTRAGVRAVDRLSIDEYHIPGIVLMENAARGAAEVAVEMLGPEQHRKTALIICGGGNNGGDGLAIARHLHLRGIDVQIALATDPAKYTGDALINWRIVDAMDMPRSVLKDGLLRMQDIALIVDAVFGTGLEQAPRSPFPALAEAINRSGVQVLAVDLPSGLDSDTGTPLGACVRATKTVTFVWEKTGFANPDSKQYTGEVIVKNIGCPPEVILRVMGEVPGSYIAT